MWMANQPAYEDHQTPEGYGLGDVDSAGAVLEAAGYTAGSDGIYTHPDDGRLTLRVGTTGGNALRELQQQIIQAQMKEAGIEITIDNVPGSDYFTNRPFSADNLLASASGGELGDPNLVDIMQFAWVGGPGREDSCRRTCREGSSRTPTATRSPPPATPTGSGTRRSMTWRLNATPPSTTRNGPPVTTRSTPT
jgi:ABC-type transport system substrate-binding protein